MTEDAAELDPKVIVEAIYEAIDDLTEQASLNVALALGRALELELEMLAEEREEAGGAAPTLRGLIAKLESIRIEIALLIAAQNGEPAASPVPPRKGVGTT